MLLLLCDVCIFMNGILLFFAILLLNNFFSLLLLCCYFAIIYLCNFIVAIFLFGFSLLLFFHCYFDLQHVFICMDATFANRTTAFIK